MQDSYIGNTTASQAVKAGSTPVSCSKRKDHPLGWSFLLGQRGSRTHLNTAARWAAVCRRPDDGNTIMSSTPVSCRPPARVVFPFGTAWESNPSKYGSPGFVKDAITGNRYIAYLLPICLDSPQCSSIFPDSLYHCESHDRRNLFAKSGIQLVWKLHLSLT